MRITNEYVFFWTADEVYSNFYYSPFYHEGVFFKWSEQAIMWRKAKLFGAEKVMKKILLAEEPQQCKILGRSKEINFCDEVWDENKEKIFLEVLRDKFKLTELREQLLSTGERELVEASPYDTIWGIGMRENHPDVTDKKKWRGQNLLGKLLTELREEIKEENKT